jgi:hypothetical protein
MRKWCEKGRQDLVNELGKRGGKEMKKNLKIPCPTKEKKRKEN